MKITVFIVAALLALPGAALAQASFPTAAPGVRAGGTVPLVCNAGGANCAPASATNPLPVTATVSSAATTETGAAAQTVQGNVANGATDAGNPIKIGGLATNAAPSAVSAGQRVNGWFNIYGAQKTTLTDDFGSGAASITVANGDTMGAANGLSVVAHGIVFNGTSWSRQRGDTTGTWVTGPSGAALATSAAQTTGNGSLATIASNTTGVATATNQATLIANQTNGTQAAKIFATADAAAGVTTATAAAGGFATLKGSAGNVYSFNIVNGATAGFVVLYDSATTVADGALTTSLVRYCMPIAANVGLRDTFPTPLAFGAGVGVFVTINNCFSKSGTGFGFVAAQVK